MTESCGENDFRARVKIVKTGEVIFLDFVRIIEFSKKEPKDVNDFDKNIIYTAYLTAEDCKSINK